MLKIGILILYQKCLSLQNNWLHNLAAIGKHRPCVIKLIKTLFRVRNVDSYIEINIHNIDQGILVIHKCSLLGRI